MNTEDSKKFKDSTPKTLNYFVNALAIDGFDMAILDVPHDGPDDKHAKVEIIFTQDKGANKNEVVAGIRMQLFELERFLSVAQEQISEFRKKGAAFRQKNQKSPTE